MPAKRPNVPLEIQLPGPGPDFTVDQLRSAIHASINDEFVKKLHAAHANSAVVNVPTGKEFHPLSRRKKSK